MKKKRVIGLCSAFALMGSMAFSTDTKAMIPTAETAPIIDAEKLSSSFDMTVEGSQVKELWDGNGEVIGTLSLDPIEMVDNVMTTYTVTLDSYHEVVRSITWKFQAYNDTNAFPSGLAHYHFKVGEPTVSVHGGYRKLSSIERELELREDPINGKPMHMELKTHVVSNDFSEGYDATIDVQGSQGTLYFDFILNRMH